MKIAFFDTHSYDRRAFTDANSNFQHEVLFLETRLTPLTAELARGCQAVCAFVNDHVDRATLEKLKSIGIQMIALRSAGYNNVDLESAKAFGLPVVRVPEYSPYAVAEHAMALILTLNRKVHRASARVHELNFSLEGLVGFDLHGKTVGVVGTGKIGAVFCKIVKGFGCRILAFDPKPNDRLCDELGVEYLPLETLCAQSDIISLHAPLLPATRHMIDDRTIGMMKDGVMLINTSRGALIDTPALIKGLKCSKIGAAGLDVYEEEENIFFFDLSEKVLQDDVLARLLTFPNVLITSHQAFLTREALKNIAETTLQSISDFGAGRPLKNQVGV